MKKLLLAVVFAAMLPFTAMAGETGVYLGLGATFNKSIHSGVDNQTGMNFNLGYDFGWFRVEGAYDRLSDDKLQTNMISGMSYIDIENHTSFTPFIGIGLGWSDLADITAAADDDGPALIGAVGTSYELNETWSFVGQYRFVGSWADVIANRGVTDNDSHMFTLGLRTTF